MSLHQPCTGWLEDISAYLDGVLDARAEQRVHAHLRECAGCAGYLVDLVPVVKALHGLPAPAPTGDPWPAIAQALKADPAFARRRWVPLGVVAMLKERQAAVGWAAAGFMFLAVGSMSYFSFQGANQVPVADTDTYWHQHQLFTQEEGLPSLYAPELRAIEASYELDE